MADSRNVSRGNEETRERERERRRRRGKGGREEGKFVNCL